ncbi:MAG: hypothetical protein LBV69_09925, partial [Bacteroidales bacterium]|nr:hypothetical protein [Bacteroidales bacterium]
MNLEKIRDNKQKLVINKKNIMKSVFYRIMVIAVIAIAFASCEKESKEMAIINSESQIVKNEGS